MADKIKANARGIEVEADARAVLDADFLDALYDLKDWAQLMQEGEDPLKELGEDFDPIYTQRKFAIKAFGRLQWKRILKQLRKNNGGELSIFEILEFVNEAVEALVKAIPKN